jgi:2-amino-4-hydroxy-6-hydroxymethyldihydropteridine diphosphokinase
MTDAFVGLGSNLGDRAAHLRRALAGLRGSPGMRLAAVSAFRETEPVGGPPQGRYLNAVARIECTLGPRRALERLLRLERRQGRARGTVRDAPRPLDLDLLLYGAARLESPELTLPHPRLEERRFVLEPLAEIAPALRLPSGRTPGESLRRLATG